MRIITILFHDSSCVRPCEHLSVCVYMSLQVTSPRDGIIRHMKFHFCFVSRRFRCCCCLSTFYSVTRHDRDALHSAPHRMQLPPPSSFMYIVFLLRLLRLRAHKTVFRSKSKHSILVSRHFVSTLPLPLSLSVSCDHLKVIRMPRSWHKHLSRSAEREREKQNLFIHAGKLCLCLCQCVCI